MKPIKITESKSSYYFYYTFEFPLTLNSKIEELKSQFNDNIGKVISIKETCYENAIITKYDSDTDEYLLHPEKDMLENKKNLNFFWVTSDKIGAKNDDQLTSMILKLVEPELFAGSYRVDEDGDLLEVITETARGFVYYSYIRDYLDPVRLNCWNHYSRLNYKFLNDPLNLKEDEKLLLQVDSDHKFSNHKYGIAPDWSDIIDKHFSLLDNFRGKEIIFKKDKDFRNDLFCVHDYILERDIESVYNEIKIDKNGEFKRGSKKYKIPKRGIEKVDLKFVLDYLKANVQDKLLEFFKLDRSYLDKFDVLIENNVVAETIQSDQVFDLSIFKSGDLIMEASALIDLPEEVLEEFENEELELGNTSYMFDDYEPSDDFDSISDGNDDEYFYYDCTIASTNYRIEFRTGAYIKDQCICDPRGISKFQLYKN